MKDKNFIKWLIAAIVALVSPMTALAADVTVQPKIMVVPYVSESEDVRTVLENDPDKRIVLTKIKEAFDSRGFTTVDFLAKLKSTSVQDAMTREQQGDLKSTIISNSGADIYVDAEMLITKSSSGNSVKVIVTGYDISTGNSLSNKVGDSGKFYTEDFGKLGARAIESCAEDFLNVLQTKFDDIVQNGRSINMTIGFDEASPLNLNSEVGNDGLTLGDLIEIWLEENSFNGNFHIQGATATKMLIDDLRIPLKDSNGNNYTLGAFGREFLKFARTNGLKITRDVVNNSLIITIQ